LNDQSKKTATDRIKYSSLIKKMIFTQKIYPGIGWGFCLLSPFSFFASVPRSNSPPFSPERVDKAAAFGKRLFTGFARARSLRRVESVIAITLFRQKKSLSLQKEVSDTTNELLKKNSEMLKGSSMFR
jgi:Toxic anion resistance protein (TelA)